MEGDAAPRRQRRTRGGFAVVAAWRVSPSSGLIAGMARVRENGCRFVGSEERRCCCPRAADRALHQSVQHLGWGKPRVGADGWSEVRGGVICCRAIVSPLDACGVALALLRSIAGSQAGSALEGALVFCKGGRVEGTGLAPGVPTGDCGSGGEPQRASAPILRGGCELTRAEEMCVCVSVHLSVCPCPCPPGSAMPRALTLPPDIPPSWSPLRRLEHPLQSHWVGVPWGQRGGTQRVLLSTGPSSPVSLCEVPWLPAPGTGRGAVALQHPPKAVTRLCFAAQP